MVAVTRTCWCAKTGETLPLLINRHAKRLPLGMTCPDIADRVEALTCKGTRVPGAAALVVDATGVRARVVDLLKSRRMPCRMIPVTITGGDKVTTDGGGVSGAEVGQQRRLSTI